MDNVAYTPFEKAIKPIVSDSQINSIPPYPDQGVAYARYSKKNLGGGSYQLFPQEKVIISGSGAYLAGSSTLIYTIPAGKKLYVVGFKLSTSGGVSTSLSYALYDNIATDLIFLDMFNGYFNFFDFSGLPVECTGPNIYFYTQPAGNFYWNLWGWIE